MKPDNLMAGYGTRQCRADLPGRRRRNGRADARASTGLDHRLGPPENWPQSLKTAVRIMLTSRQPMFVWWGDELINLYNDAYKSIVGGKHPRALGPAGARWSGARSGTRSARAPSRRCAANEGTYDEALLLIMERNGYPEETYYTFSYSPVPDDEGGTGGIICANTDDTAADHRRAPAGAAARAGGAHRRCAHRRGGLRAQRAAPGDQSARPAVRADLPGRARTARSVLAGRHARHRSAAIRRRPRRSRSTAAIRRGPSRRCCAAQRAARSSTTSRRASARLPTGAWDRPPTQAAVAAHRAVRRDRPRRRPGRRPESRSACSTTATAASSTWSPARSRAAIANAQAYEEERRRAEALAEIDRAKTAFFSNVSHEFRTPLTLMLGPLEDVLAEPRAPPPRRARALSTSSHRNGLRLLKLVNTLLDFSRIEAGRVQASYEPTDLARAHRRSRVALSARRSKRAGLALDVECAPLPEPGLRRPRHVGEDRAQPALERVQVHVRRARSRSSCAPTRDERASSSA